MFFEKHLAFILKSKLAFIGIYTLDTAHISFIIKISLEPLNSSKGLEFANLILNNINILL